MKFPFHIMVPDLMYSHGLFQWLDDMGLDEYQDWQVLSLPDKIVGIAFKDGGMAALCKLRFSLS
jgi:hypothetical protein